MFNAAILADSCHERTKADDGSNLSGTRLVTMVLTYPRCIHSEFMTHRQFSRNASSSRAIPIEKMIAQVVDHPFIPLVWGTNKPGMQAGDAHGNPGLCTRGWLYARDAAVSAAHGLNAMGLHKQTVNRILEPWMWITVIASGVDHAWENFFKLRCHPDAEPHIQKIAYMARKEYDAGKPNPLAKGVGWHMPLVGFPGDEELVPEALIKVSVARCARVSYETHDGKRDVNADLILYNRLKASGHWSPFEHVATPCAFMLDNKCGNFTGRWIQHRKQFGDEYCKLAPRGDAP